jgi:hypothetical protein
MSNLSKDTGQAIIPFKTSPILRMIEVSTVNTYESKKRYSCHLEFWADLFARLAQHALFKQTWSL